MDGIARLIGSWLASEGWVLCLDRTNWQIGVTNVNIVSNHHHTQQWVVTRLFSIQVQEVMILSKPRMLWGHKLYIGATRTEDEYVIIISNVKAPLLTDYLRFLL